MIFLAQRCQRITCHTGCEGGRDMTGAKPLMQKQIHAKHSSVEQKSWWDSFSADHPSFFGSCRLYFGADCPCRKLAPTNPVWPLPSTHVIQKSPASVQSEQACFSRHDRFKQRRPMTWQHIPADDYRQNDRYIFRFHRMPHTADVSILVLFNLDSISSAFIASPKFNIRNISLAIWSTSITYSA